MTEALAGHDSPIVRAAERLRHAQSVGRPCEPIRDLIDRDDVTAAYAIQQHVATLQKISGARVVGRKLGLTSSAVQAQLQVPRQTIGTLMDSMQVDDGGSVPLRRLLQPLIESEIAFLLAEDLDDPAVDAARARSAVGEMRAALEIVDSRVRDWDISMVDTIADNASAGLFAVATEGRPVQDRDLRSLRMELSCGGQVVSTGSGADNCLGDPLEGLAWLAREACRQGTPLRAGMLILAGALGPMVPIREGDAFRAVIGDLPPVSLQVRSSAALRRSAQ